MNQFVQYHNVEQEGLPLGTPLFGVTRLGIHTRRPQVERAEGRVFLIAGIGKPRRYFLWETFVIEEVNPSKGGEYEAWGTGWQLAPPQELKGRAFDAFRDACANFVGFRDITDLPYAQTLAKLAGAHRPPGDPEVSTAFLYAVRGLLKKDATALDAVDDALTGLLAGQTPKRALSIRQPHAEAIMRGVKTVEYRSGPTHIRGKVLIYAGLGRYPADDEAEMMREYRIADVTCDSLPRGVIVGTVELYDCDGGDWHIRRPERADRLVRPKNQPQPSWFRPF